MAIKKKCDALVVGAGPVGLFGAICLAEHGIDVQLADKDQRGAARAFGLALHGSTLALLDRYGLADPLIAEGNRVERLGLWVGDERRAEVELTGGSGPFPFVLTVPQSSLEQVLRDELKRRKIRTHWSHKLMQLTPDGDVVNAQVAKMDQVSTGYPIARTEWVVDRVFDVRASFVIGADGFHSGVRGALGIDYREVGSTEVFAVFEFPESTAPRGECRIVLGRETHNVHWPLPNDGGRWSFQVPLSGDERPDLEQFRSLLHRRAPWYEGVPQSIQWSSLIRFDRRLASSAGRERTWLAGDAIHLTSPVGIQSMNVGLREAHELAANASDVIKGGAQVGTLQAYGDDRTSEWRRLLGLVGNLRPTADVPALDGEQARRVMPCLPASGEELARLMAQIGYALD